MQVAKSLASARKEPSGAADIVLRLSTARGVDEIMAVVREDLRGLIGADGITFVLRDGDKCFYAEEDAIGPLWRGQRFPLENCISGWSMLQRSVAVIEDIYADDRIPHAAYRPTFVKSLAMVPVRQDDPVGAIGAYWAHRHRPGKDELNLLQTVANGAAVAMTNVALMNSLVAARDEAVKAKEAIILAMASLAETRDNETGVHIHRTQQYMRVLVEACLARKMYAPTLDATLADLICKSTPLHDIGKVGIPDKILRKPGRLDADEFEIMKQHAELGRAAIANAERHLGTCTAFFQVAKDIAVSHHEKWDGTGYPGGIQREDIPLPGRMMAIVDVYDALISRRVYKSAMPHEQAVAIIADESGRHFDPELVRVFLEIAEDFHNIARFLPDDEDGPVNPPPASV